MKNSVIKAVAVDDEQHAIDLLKGVLTLFDNSIEVIGEANNLPDAVKLINTARPDVVFLDIDMPKYSGIQIADFFENDRDFEIVFVTAHGQYAIDALRIKAFDYLMKPLDPDSLEKCYHRLCEAIAAKQQGAGQNAGIGEKETVMVQSHDGTIYIDTMEITHLEASRVYCIVHMMDRTQHIVSKPMGDFFEQLPNYFMRVHRSFAVNARLVRKKLTKEGDELELKNGIRIPISKSHKDDFEAYMLKN
jgi:two-component system, LytTR family, response regulator